MQITGHRGVICDLDCWLYLNFTVVSVHCFYAAESIVLNINQVKYYPMLQKTAEGNECGWITAAKILKRDYRDETNLGQFSACHKLSVPG